MQKSRDNRRQAELKQIQTGLELYRSDVGSYPVNLGTSLTNSTTGAVYIQNVPKDPKLGTSYGYSPAAAPAATYALYACAENTTDIQVKDVCAGSVTPPNCSPAAITGCTSAKYYVVVSP
jgi:hypothetical protein